MYTASSYEGVKRLMKELSVRLGCGERVGIRLGRPELLTSAISEARVNGLSVVDAYENRDQITIVVENRFGSRCYGG